MAIDVLGAVCSNRLDGVHEGALDTREEHQGQDTKNPEASEGITQGDPLHRWTSQQPMPQSFEDRPIPDVLTQGNHKEIFKWRRTRAEDLTKERRPDLWTLYEKTKR